MCRSRQRAGTVYPQWHVEISPYISTKGLCGTLLFCAAGIVLLLPPQPQTALGKGTDFKSAQSLAHLQQLILRQRAQHCTLRNADSLTFACQRNRLLMGQWVRFKRGIKKGAADSGCLISRFLLLCFWLFDAGSNSLIVLTNPNPGANVMPVWRLRPSR